MDDIFQVSSLWLL